MRSFTLALLLLSLPALYANESSTVDNTVENTVDNTVDNTKPNIIYFLVDDWGHSNVGYHHAENPTTATEIQAKLEAHTPNIDKLLQSGIELDRHYSYKICSPSRSSLQSGRHATHVNPLNVGVLNHNPDDPISGFQGIPINMTGLGDVMGKGGYSRHFVGKWDTGMATPEHTPQGRGYESFFGYFQVSAVEPRYFAIDQNAALFVHACFVAHRLNTFWARGDCVWL